MYLQKSSSTHRELYSIITTSTNTDDLPLKYSKTVKINQELEFENFFS